MVAQEIQILSTITTAAVELIEQLSTLHNE